MTGIILAFGVFITALGVVGVLRPGELIRLVETIWRSQGGIYLVVALRLGLGAVLIAAAPECRYPLAIRVLGYVSLLSGVAAAVMGRRRIRSLLDWWTQRPPTLIRVWSVAAVAFGAFLAYAAS
jgi:hypothetical protein